MFLLVIQNRMRPRALLQNQQIMGSNCFQTIDVTHWTGTHTTTETWPGMRCSLTKKWSYWCHMPVSTESIRWGNVSLCDIWVPRTRSSWMIAKCQTILSENDPASNSRSVHGQTVGHQLQSLFFKVFADVSLASFRIWPHSLSPKLSYLELVDKYNNLTSTTSVKRVIVIIAIIGKNCSVLLMSSLICEGIILHALSIYTGIWIWLPVYSSL